MNNGRFATCLHILTLLNYNKGKLLSSEYIAGSININPAIVRKEIGNLTKHGLIESREGKGGGSSLARAAKDIKLTDIYYAIRQAPLLGRKNHPNPDCPVGKQINLHLDKLYNEAEEATIKKLEKITLQDFSKQIK